MRIGLPQALLYYKYGSFWKKFLRDIGIEVITSPETTNDILADGIKHSIGDICLPVKAFFGHILALKDHVDYLFIPRVIRVEEDAYLCPKILGLPDMVRAAVRNLPPIIDTEFNKKEKNWEDFWKEVLKKLKVKKKIPVLYNLNFDGPRLEFIHLSKDTEDKKLTVGIAGRPYLIMDECLNKGIIRKMSRVGADVVYCNPDQNYIEDTMNMLPKWVYWSMGKEVVSSVRRMLENDIIDGIVLLSNAGCGPDSFISDIIEHKLYILKKPYMNLIIDEHLSDIGIQTRIEAFVDMIERKSKKFPFHPYLVKEEYKGGEGFS